MKELAVNDFSLKETLECGQALTWFKEGAGYVTADLGQVLYVEQEGNTLLYDASHCDVSLTRIFRLDDPIQTIQNELAKDELIQASIQYAPRLRLISEPFYPCLISFICSAWNNIPRIRGLTQAIRASFGPKYEFRDKVYYGMPTPETLANVSSRELRKLGTGWRSKFIIESSKSLVEEVVVPEGIRRMEYAEAHSELKRLHGVGDKIADCVLLYSIGKLEAFPIDVWIERVIEKQYGFFAGSGKSYPKKSAAARQYFGRYAGYAQQYLYHYSKCGLWP